MSKTKWRAVIFDLDDTLFNTAGAWRRARRAFLRELGVEASGAALVESTGHSARTTALTLAARFSATERTDSWQEIFIDALHEAVRSTPPPLMPGARQIIHALYGRCQLGVASGSPGVVIETLLGQAGIGDMFECVLSSENFGRCKPAPDVFLGAAERLQVEPDCCLVIEDSLVGVQAARAASMACFAIPSQAAQVSAIQALGARPFSDLRAASLAIAQELGA